MSSTLTSPPQQAPLSPSASPPPPLSLQSSPELTWIDALWVAKGDRISQALPLVLIGVPLGIVMLLISALTPADLPREVLWQTQPPEQVSPDQVTRAVDVQDP